MTARLAKVAIATDAQDYRLCFRLEDGTRLEICASADQLDRLAEDIDRRLDADREIPLPDL